MTADGVYAPARLYGAFASWRLGKLSSRSSRRIAIFPIKPAQAWPRDFGRALWTSHPRFRRGHGREECLGGCRLRGRFLKPRCVRICGWQARGRTGPRHAAHKADRRLAPRLRLPAFAGLKANPALRTAAGSPNRQARRAGLVPRDGAPQDALLLITGGIDPAGGYFCRHPTASESLVPGTCAMGERGAKNVCAGGLERHGGQSLGKAFPAPSQPQARRQGYTLGEFSRNRWRQHRALRRASLKPKRQCQGCHLRVADGSGEQPSQTLTGQHART